MRNGLTFIALGGGGGGEGEYRGVVQEGPEVTLWMKKASTFSLHVCGFRPEATVSIRMQSAPSTERTDEALDLVSWELLGRGCKEQSALHIIHMCPIRSFLFCSCNRWITQLRLG